MDPVADGSRGFKNMIEAMKQRKRKLKNIQKNALLLQQLTQSLKKGMNKNLNSTDKKTKFVFTDSLQEEMMQEIENRLEKEKPDANTISKLTQDIYQKIGHRYKQNKTIGHVVNETHSKVVGGGKPRSYIPHATVRVRLDKKTGQYELNIWAPKTESRGERVGKINGSVKIDNKIKERLKEKIQTHTRTFLAMPESSSKHIRETTPHTSDNTLDVSTKLPRYIDTNINIFTTFQTKKPVTTVIPKLKTNGPLISPSLKSAKVLRTRKLGRPTVKRSAKATRAKRLRKGRPTVSRQMKTRKSLKRLTDDITEMLTAVPQFTKLSTKKSKLSLRETLDQEIKKLFHQTRDMHKQGEKMSHRPPNFSLLDKIEKEIGSIAENWPENLIHNKTTFTSKPSFAGPSVKEFLFTMSPKITEISKPSPSIFTSVKPDKTIDNIPSESSTQPSKPPQKQTVEPSVKRMPDLQFTYLPRIFTFHPITMKSRMTTTRKRYVFTPKFIFDSEEDSMLDSEVSGTAIPTTKNKMTKEKKTKKLHTLTPSQFTTFSTKTGKPTFKFSTPIVTTASKVVTVDSVQVAMQGNKKLLTTKSSATTRSTITLPSSTKSAVAIDLTTPGVKLTTIQQTVQTEDPLTTTKLSEVKTRTIHKANKSAPVIDFTTPGIKLTTIQQTTQTEEPLATTQLFKVETRTIQSDNKSEKIFRTKPSDLSTTEETVTLPYTSNKQGKQHYFTFGTVRGGFRPYDDAWWRLNTRNRLRSPNSRFAQPLHLKGKMFSQRPLRSHSKIKPFGSVRSFLSGIRKTSTEKVQHDLSTLVPFLQSKIRRFYENTPQSIKRSLRPYYNIRLHPMNPMDTEEYFSLSSEDKDATETSYFTTSRSTVPSSSRKPFKPQNTTYIEKPILSESYSSDKIKLESSNYSFNYKDQLKIESTSPISRETESLELRKPKTISVFSPLSSYKMPTLVPSAVQIMTTERKTHEKETESAIIEKQTTLNMLTTTPIVFNWNHQVTKPSYKSSTSEFIAATTTTTRNTEPTASTIALTSQTTPPTTVSSTIHYPKTSSVFKDAFKTVLPIYEEVTPRYETSHFNQFNILSTTPQKSTIPTKQFIPNVVWPTFKKDTTSKPIPKEVIHNIVWPTYQPEFTQKSALPTESQSFTPILTTEQFFPRAYWPTYQRYRTYRPKRVTRTFKNPRWIVKPREFSQLNRRPPYPRITRPSQSAFTFSPYENITDFVMLSKQTLDSSTLIPITTELSETSPSIERKSAPEVVWPPYQDIVTSTDHLTSTTHEVTTIKTVQSSSPESTTLQQQTFKTTTTDKYDSAIYPDLSSMVDEDITMQPLSTRRPRNSTRPRPTKWWLDYIYPEKYRELVKDSSLEEYYTDEDDKDYSFLPFDHNTTGKPYYSKLRFDGKDYTFRPIYVRPTTPEPSTTTAPTTTLPPTTKPTPKKRIHHYIKKGFKKLFSVFRFGKKKKNEESDD